MERVSKTWEIYLFIENKAHLIGYEKKIFSFLGNDNLLKFGDKTLVKDLFKSFENPEVVCKNPVVVCENEYVIIGKRFHFELDETIYIDFSINVLVEDLLKYFIKKVGKEKFLGNKTITFEYEGHQKISKDLKIKIDNFFKNSKGKYFYTNIVKID